MTTIAAHHTREECLESACIHNFHEVDRSDPEDRAFHETAAIEASEADGRYPTYRVRVTKFENEDRWYVEADVRVAPLSAEDALSLADAIRLQAGVAYELTEEMSA
ncbi:hypothetical protein [Leifsonia sp. AG29]|uniref:hypothetical protein n=1 Tax=Leifsonia sp. AG29 TaxID=2598860 RepID=UPI00131A6F50|nr:hypothetical protein [Leifsonia sp. AG29]